MEFGFESDEAKEWANKTYDLACYGLDVNGRPFGWEKLLISNKII